MKTVLLIINYNDFESTSNLLKNVEGYPSIDKILVVDNASCDDSYKKLLALGSAKIEVKKTQSNRGYSSAINFGCHYLIKKYKQLNIIISNADIVINKDKDISELVELLNSKKDYAVVAPVVIENQAKNRGWKIPSPIVEVGLNIPYFHRLIRKHFVHYKDDYYKGDKTMVEAVSGCFFIIKSDVLKEIGFLDENVFLYYEENILAKQVSQLDKKIVLANQVQVIHNHSVSINKNMSKIKKYKALKKSQYYFQTHYNNANIFEKILLKVSSFLSVMLYTIYYFFLDLFK